MSKWYKNGLAFSCKGCGRCCSGPAEGYVWVTQKDIEAMADYVGMAVDKFKKKYVRRVGMRYSLIEKQPSKDCVFLTETETGKGCTVYPVRPIQCRTWPFWKENLDTKDDWDDASRGCPGMDQGEWSELERIEKLRKGDLDVNDPQKCIMTVTTDWIEANIDNKMYLQAVGEIYEEIDSVLHAAGAECGNCGQCCHFHAFGHRLYATTLEMLFFYRGLVEDPELKKQFNPKALNDGQCPFQTKDGCVLRFHRPSGCRIFYCQNLSEAFQNELTEQILCRLQALHQQFDAVYYYADFLEWMKAFADKKMI